MAMAIPSTLCFLLLVLVLAQVAVAAPRAFIVFGDSLVDAGNNNYLVTTARADAPPYGIDYPTRRPTGRFSNGYNMPDLISQRLGSESVLPYLSPQFTGKKLLIGANFASAGIGVLNDTGMQFLNIIRMHTQLDHFREYKQRVSAIIGAAATKRLVNQALFLMCVGGNDFVNNYYLVPYSARSRQYPDVGDYIKYLIKEYKKLLHKVYQMGARRVLVTGSGPMGCVPAELAQRGTNGGCSKELQRAASLYNPQLIAMVKQLNSELGGDFFIAVNTMKMHHDFVNNPRAYGFITSKIACCGQGPYNGIGLCTPLSNLCPDRKLYAFWDPFHPSERANRFIVEDIMGGNTDYMSPMNLSTILALDART